jgi:GGDEF domain-containing protein
VVLRTRVTLSRGRVSIRRAVQVAFDASQYVVGDEWAYRLRDTAPSERVRIKAVTPKKVTASIEVEFLDDGGHRVQTVPSTRLKTRWADVEAYDAQQEGWQRIVKPRV